MSWNTANDAVLAEGRRVLIEDPHRFDGVRVIGVDEHCWRHTRRGDKYVTVIIDLTPIRDGTGPARLLDGRGPIEAGVQATWGIYQHMIAAYREPDRKRGRELMQQLIGSISHSVPTALREVITLGRTLKRRAVDVLAYFDRPGTSDRPTEAINGRLEHLRGSALGFRNLTNYIARSLLETGGFRPRLHPRS